MTTIDEPRATFTAMTEGTAEDYAAVAHNSLLHSAGLADRVLDHLRLLEGDHGGFPVDRMEHSLQTATRAYRANESDELVVCALIHDIGDTLGSYNHADIGAAVLKPFVSDAHHWMLAHHGIFQGYYFFHHLGLDRDMRRQFEGHEHYDLTATFCHEYDQAAFDVDYESLPLEHFEPAVRQLLSQPQRTIYQPDLATG